MKRCGWAECSEINWHYHDTEWGVPSRRDRHLFEMLILEGAQAGLSWTTILKKRKNYKNAFANFDAEKVARYTKRDKERLLKNEGIVRNKLKIEAAIENARSFLDVQDECGSFSGFIWQFVDNNPIQNEFTSLREIPAETAESRAMSKELKRRGFRFVGPTICYAFMQAVGMVNDHEKTCFRYREIKRL